ncbi:MAG TPA: RsmE family RNA methyltransferase [Dictyobacter sp.]|jgi:16S rRNA (uracil1498-N3)-methyltransferase|nr:RsmE family RNA methyltransferase [Dictyobacter sp.]
MHRFFLGSSEIAIGGAGLTLILPDKLAHQIRDVLRLQIGEALVLFDSRGDEYLCTVASSNRMEVVVEVQERRTNQNDPVTRVILCQGLLKSARFEWILEKGTELGVASFAPVQTQRSQAGLEGAGSSKLQRWQRILQEATEQCGRSHVPTLEPICSLKQVLSSLPAGSLAIMPWEEENGCSLYDVLHEVPDVSASSPLTVVIFIGPEGGLTAEEVELARAHAVRIVSLGRRILRAETAALATVANVMYELESRLER